MSKEERDRLMVLAAKMYYERDCSQEEIAQHLGLSRPYISKLVHAAKKAGLVRIQVLDPLDLENSVEKEIRERFNLKKAIVTPSAAGEDSGILGKAAARYLDGILEDGDIIATSWGATMLQVSSALIPRSDLPTLQTVQLCGGVSPVNSAVYASEIATNYAKALGAACYLMQVPAVVGSVSLKETLFADINMVKVVDLARKARIAIFTVGAFGADGERSALVQAGYLDPGQIRVLKEKGAVGDVACHMIDAKGQLCSEELDDKTMAIALSEIAKKEYRIAVAQGVSKIPSIMGALRTGVINVLITSESTAKSLLQSAS